MVFLQFSCQLGGRSSKRLCLPFWLPFQTEQLSLGVSPSRRLPCPTSLEEIGVFPTPSLPQKGSGMGGEGRIRSTGQVRGQPTPWLGGLFANALLWS